MPYQQIGVTTVRQARIRGLFDALPPDRITRYGRGEEILGLLADCSNIYPGTMETRRGSAGYLTSAVADPIQGLWPFIRQTTGTRQILWASNGTLYRDDGTSIESGLRSSGQFNFVTFKDIAYYVTGDASDSLRQWDATTAAAVTPYATGGNELNDGASAIHSSQYIAMFGNRCLLGGNATIPYRVYTSDLTRVATAAYGLDNFQSTAAFDFHSSRGGGVTGFVPGDDVCFVLKGDSVHLLTLDSNSALAQYPALPDLGCPAGRTAMMLPGLGVVFQAEDGHVYTIRSDLASATRFRAVCLTRHISTFVGTINKPYLSTASAQVIRSAAGDFYLLHVPSGNATVPDRTLACAFKQVGPFVDPITGDEDPTALFVPWAVWDFDATQSAGSVGVTYDTGTSVLYLTGDATTGQIWKLEQSTYQDNGTTLSDFVLTAKHHFAAPDVQKMLRDLTITYAGTATANSLTIQIYADDNNPVSLSSLDMLGNPSYIGSFVIGTDTIAVRAGNRTARSRANFRGQLFQAKLSHSHASNPMKLFEADYGYFPIRRV